MLPLYQNLFILFCRLKYNSNRINRTKSFGILYCVYVQYMHVYNKLLMNLSEAENVYTLVYIEGLSAKSLSLISLKPKKNEI